MTKKDLNNLEQIITDKLRQELSPKLYYHSVDHTKRVVKNVAVFGTYHDISPKDMKLLKIAALFHDSGFIYTIENHEEASCEIAREFLLKFNMTENDILKVCGMIMATKIPQTPINLLEKIIADADLEYLGTDDFEKIGGYLFQELKEINPNLTFAKWNEIQINFIEKHLYFTEYGQKYLSRTKKKHLMELKNNF